MLIDYEIADGVAIATMNRPEALNALNAAVLSELDSICDRVVADGARVLIVTGAGRSFVAGADIAEMATMTKAEALEFGRKGSGVFRKLEELPCATIAAVNGFALGGGCELAMSCDIRIASEKASFALPEATLGVTPGFGGTQRLPRLVGLGIAKQLVFTGERIKADKALEIGLVNAVYTPEELMSKAAELAAAIAKNSPVAVRADKRAINAGLQVDIDSALEIEAREFSGTFESEDQREGMGAFVEKREAKPFTGK